MHLIRTLLAIALAGALAGCGQMVRTVKPVADTTLSEVCIQDNPDVLGFLPDLYAELDALGIKYAVYQGPPPPSCRHHLEFNASWRWALKMHLAHVELRVYENRKLIGEALYDARPAFGVDQIGGGSSAKLKALVEELFGRKGGKR